MRYLQDLREPVPLHAEVVSDVLDDVTLDCVESVWTVVPHVWEINPKTSQ